MVGRASKSQKQLLVERLHANMEFARGNIADAAVKEFWLQLVLELNQLGCQRTVVEWQHNWDVWRSKVKSKARKVRDSINATGGGPAGPGLSDIDNKILEIIGPASVYGFASLEQGLRAEPIPVVSLQPAAQGTSPSEPESQSEPAAAELNLGQTRRVLIPRVRPRLDRRLRPPRPASVDLAQALTENNSLLREVIERVGGEMAAAVRESAAATIRAADILAAAVRQLAEVVIINQGFSEENNP